MKKAFTFFAITLILAACGGNVAKFKPMIDELAGNWDNTTSSITELSNMANAEQTNLLNLTNGLNIDAAVMEKWDEATASSFANIKSTIENNSKGLALLTSDLDGFMSSWKEKGNDLQALKDGLAAGKLGDDAQGKITALTSAVSDATSKLDGWKGQLGTIKDVIARAAQMFADFKAANNLG